MRYEGQLLTMEESLRLIDEMDSWCRKTGTNYNKLVVAARVACSTRHMVRIKGRRLTETVAKRIRNVMSDNRRGISKDRYRTMAKPWRPEVVAIVAAFEPVRVTSETCRRCGSRWGKCEHTLSADMGGVRYG